MNNKDHENKLANRIVDKDYQNTKRKNPLTQVAERAKDLLGYKFNSTTGTMRNSEGHEVPMKDAVKTNEMWENNFQDQKKADYINKLKNQKTLPAENPTINRYKAFRQQKQQKLEDEKYKQNFNKEYGDQAIKNNIRAKQNKNIRAGKRPYENFTTSEIIVAEDTIDQAKKNLKFLNKKSEQLPLPNIDILIEPKPSELPDFKTFMKSVAPIKDPDLDAGIAGLEEVKNFKNTMDHADQKFPKKARGIGPFLTGEND